MNPQDELQLEVWQQLKAMGIPPEQRMQALDDQMRIDSLLRSFFSDVRADEYEHQLRVVSAVMSEEASSCVTDTRQLSA